MLNIRSTNGMPITSRYCSGYIISAARENCVHVGITKVNTIGFHLTKLGVDRGHVSDPRDWAAVPMPVSVNRSPYDVIGTALIDTGIAKVRITSNLPF